MPAGFKVTLNRIGNNYEFYDENIKVKQQKVVFLIILDNFFFYFTFP